MKSVEMKDKMPNEDHIRYCMVYEFYHGKKASEAARLINQIYPYSVDVRKCLRWFSRFKLGNFDLSRAPR